MTEPTLHRECDARAQARTPTPSDLEPTNPDRDPAPARQRNGVEDPPVPIGELLGQAEVVDALLPRDNGKAGAEGSTGTAEPKPTARQARRQRKQDRSLRRRWYSAVKRSGVSPGCKSWLYSLADRSDDAAKPVWGRQTKQAAEIDRCARSVRRYRAEAESAGLVRTIRSEPVQDATTGQWSRPHSNTYLFVIPARTEAERWRAAKQERRSHRADRYCRSTPPTEVENRPETGASSPPSPDVTPPPPPAPTRRQRRPKKDPGRNRSGDLPRFARDPTPSHSVPEPTVRHTLAAMRAELQLLGTKRRP